MRVNCSRASVKLHLSCTVLGDIDLLLVGVTKLQLLARIGIFSAYTYYSVRVAYLILLPLGIGSGELCIKYLYGITETW